MNSEEALETLQLYAIDLFNKGLAEKEVAASLVLKGLDVKDALNIAGSALKRQSSRQRALRDMQVGAVLTSIGMVISLGTYFAAVSNPNGGTSILAYGAIIVGSWRLIRGLATYNA